MFSIRRTLLPLALFSLLTLHSCKTRTESGKVLDTAPTTGDWVIKHELSDFSGLNPATTSDAEASYFFNQHLYETLLFQDWKTLEFTPWLVDSLPTVSADHLTYTWHLKRNITFSDGTPLTAGDVLFSLKAIMNPLVINGQHLRNYFNRVKDAQAPNDSTFIVYLSEPYFLMDHQLGTNIWVQPKHLLDPKGLTDQYSFADCIDLQKARHNKPMAQFADWFGSSELSKEPKYLVGSGPYIVKEWIMNDRVVAVRNPNYWNKGAKWGTAYPDRLVMKTVNDFNTAVTALKNGELDFVTGITPSIWAKEIDVARTPQIHKDSYFYPVIYYVGWNNDLTLFHDKRVRQAMSLFCDVSTMIDKVMFGLGRPIFGMTYFMRKECHPSLKPYGYDPVKAKALLADAGWKDTDGDGVLDKMINGQKVDFKFTFLLNAGNEVRKQTALILSEELRKAGIVAEIQMLEFSVFLKNLRDHKFDAYIGAWSVPSDSPDEFQIWHSSQAETHGSNYVSYKNPALDSIIDANRTEFDETKRIALMRRFQEILYEDQPYTFLWTPKDRVAFHTRFRGQEWFSAPPGYDIAQWWVPGQLRKYADVKE
jgi:peptide/nickel transport system substrate-binding protein